MPVPWSPPPSSNLRLKTPFLLVASAVILAAQIGQYPPGQYPPGQYPPGRYPGGNGPGIPSRGPKRSKTEEKNPAPTTQTFSGVIRSLTDKSFEMDSTDTRILAFEISEKTVKPADLKKGEGVDVEATQDNDGTFHAVSIKKNAEVARNMPAMAPDIPTEPPPGSPAPAGTAEPTAVDRPSTTMSPAPPSRDADDPGPPQLKRGKPVAHASTHRPEIAERAAAAPTTAGTAPEAPAAAPMLPSTSRQALVDKAREVASTFLEGLPNYICQEMATRYSSETKEPSWNVIDVVSAELVYDKGKEDYRNVAINGKATKKKPEETGAWSSGEFGTILRNVLDPFTAAEFRYVRDDTIVRRPASVYDFKVERVRSTWKIWVPGQYILPAYKGSLWIDKESGHVLRIEMQAREIPQEFPRATTETAVDYDFVSLGTPEKFLLPVHAEVLSCARGSYECERNTIEFRNYHKFTGESTIKFSQ